MSVEIARVGMDRSVVFREDAVPAENHATPLDATEWLLVALIAFAPALTAETIRWRGGGRAVWVA